MIAKGLLYIIGCAVWPLLLLGAGGNQPGPAAAAANRAVVHPAQGLLDECNAARAMLGKERVGKHNAELERKIRACRERLLAYTRQHAGADLDAERWSRAAVGCMWLSSRREWRTFKDADKAIREAVNALGGARPKDMSLSLRTIFEVVLLHEQEWYKRAPEECGQWLDELNGLVNAGGDRELRARWVFFAPNREVNLIFAAQGLEVKQRKAFQAEREKRLCGYLNDETIPLEWRTQAIWWWAVNLKTDGNMEKAAQALDQWRQKYDQKLQLPLFFEIRLLVALHSGGDLETARKMMLRMRALVDAGLVAADNRSWVNMNEKYYAYILMSGEEIKAKYREELDQEFGRK